MRQARDRLIAKLRGLLARDCVAALEPDLVILDEFQRFHDLLHGASEAAELARHLFDYVDDQGNETRTLLLSATPYRMLTIAGDAAEDGEHQKDFLEVMRSCSGGTRATCGLQSPRQRCAASVKACSPFPAASTTHVLRAGRSRLVYGG